ncbi:unnamed protein product [Adineta steineri]|uniref:C-type lectin domain-containing protein n=1 Tax=Adineta steineri TaxID=433720 RepID=A0A815JA51_9BILA|nr:unnamed protein product [Adineta steineri]CAF3526098.1 unnamed protein product [Adineta steineri]
MYTVASLLPKYNPLTRCHDLPVIDANVTFVICLQRESNKQHSYNFYTSSSFCQKNYSSYGDTIDLFSLSSSTIDLFLQSLTNLFNSKDAHLFPPEPNFLWIGSNLTQNLTTNQFWCPEQCQPKNPTGKFLILKLRCQYDNNSNKSCITTRHTHWDRAPFICIINQTLKKEQEKKQELIPVSPSYSNDTIVFYDSTSCLVVRTRTHQYTFCFRRQVCTQGATSAFCTAKFQAYDVCQKEKNNSNLLSIENDDEYELINNIISRYGHETLMNSDGTIRNKNVPRAQWIWIDGLRGWDSNNIYHWNISGDVLTTINDKYWCNTMTNCSGGKGRDHVILNIICQPNEKDLQVCLSSRPKSEPGPFICKRTLTKNEEPISNYTFLKNSTIPTSTTTITPTTTPVIPPSEKHSTLIYYDEERCLNVESGSHIYTFCLRRQTCPLKKQAFCTKWTTAQEACQSLDKDSNLLTIDNEEERILITDIMKNYINETRLTFSGRSNQHYGFANFVWIDGIQQTDSQIYLWKNGLESIPDYLWCSKKNCNQMHRERVMINLLCNKNNSLICLSTHYEWKLAPYICKRIRPKDQCQISINYNHTGELLVLSANRTKASIKCRHPDYSQDIKIEYQCDTETKKWISIYKNNNFTCPEYKIPPLATSAPTLESTTKIIPATSTPISYTASSTTTSLSYIAPSTTTVVKDSDCSQMELSLLISQLPTQFRYVQPTKLSSYSPYFYNVRLSCYFNQSIEMTYRCDLPTKRWIYINGSIDSFRNCYPPCNNTERYNLLNKYFTTYEQSQIRTRYIEKYKSLLIQCLSVIDRQWKSINYKCGTMSITVFQWYKIHSCFQPIITTTPPPPTTVATQFPLSLGVAELKPLCPPVVIRGSPCEYEVGQYVHDKNGCIRKLCPSLSHLCNTIRCPSDRRCRVVICKSCIHTDYLQAVCESPTVPSLCELEKRLLLLNNTESINQWIHQTISVVQQYAKKQQQRLTLS